MTQKRTINAHKILRSEKKKLLLHLSLLYFLLTCNPSLGIGATTLSPRFSNFLSLPFLFLKKSKVLKGKLERKAKESQLRVLWDLPWLFHIRNNLIGDFIFFNFGFCFCFEFSLIVFFFVCCEVNHSEAYVC